MRCEVPVCVWDLGSGGARGSREAFRILALRNAPRARALYVGQACGEGDDTRAIHGSRGARGSGRSNEDIAAVPHQSTVIRTDTARCVRMAADGGGGSEGVSRWLKGCEKA